MIGRCIGNRQPVCRQALPRKPRVRERGRARERERVRVRSRGGWVRAVVRRRVRRRELVLVGLREG